MPFVTDGGLVVTPFDKRKRHYGLLSVCDPIRLPDPHWQTGVEWESDCSVETSSTLPPCPEALGEKSTDGGLIFCSAEPFTVYGSYKCSTGGRPATDSIAIAQNRLIRNRERSVEQIFWTGVTSVGNINPNLQAGNLSCGIQTVDLTPLSGPLDPTGAMALLDSALTECIPGSLGVIHFTFGFLNYLFRNLLISERDGKFYTVSEHQVIAGAGYPGSGPGNVPVNPGETWVFATGPLVVYDSDVFFTPSNIDQSIDRSLNNITFFAEQTYAIIWECCVFAVRVTLCD